MQKLHSCFAAARKYRDLSGFKRYFVSKEGETNGDKLSLDVLWLIGWCRNVGDACVKEFREGLFADFIITKLQHEKLLKRYDEIYGWRLTRAGYRYLQSNGISLYPEPHTQRVGRRFEYAEIVVTMFLAGISPFLTAISELREQNGYLPAFALRGRRGQQVMGSSQMAGLLRLGDTIYAVYYVYPGMDRVINPFRESDFLQKLCVGCGCRKCAYLFCGSSYAAIHDALLQKIPEDHSRKLCVSYGQFFDTTREPCLYLPCTAYGVQQLRLLKIPQYKTKLRKILWVDDDREALELGADWIDQERRAVGIILVDMELKRIEQTAFRVRRAGYEQMLLAVLSHQKSFLKQYYRPPFYGFADLSPRSIALLEGRNDHAPV